MLHELIWDCSLELVHSCLPIVKKKVYLYKEKGYLSEEDYLDIAYKSAFEAITTFLKKEHGIESEDQYEEAKAILEEAKDNCWAYFWKILARNCCNLLVEEDVSFEEITETKLTTEDLTSHEYKDSDEYIKVALSVMTKQQRQVWKYILKHHGVSHAEVAKVFGKSRQSISLIIQRGLERVRNNSKQIREELDVQNSV